MGVPLVVWYSSSSYPAYNHMEIPTRAHLGGSKGIVGILVRDYTRDVLRNFHFRRGIGYRV